MDAQKKKRLTNILFIACLLAVFVHAIFMLNEKKGLFLDETCTFQFSNYKRVSVEMIVDAIKNGYSGETLTREYSWLSSTEVLDKYTTIESGKFNLLSILLCD